MTVKRKHINIALKTFSHEKKPTFIQKFNLFLTTIYINMVKMFLNLKTIKCSNSSEPRSKVVEI